MTGQWISSVLCTDLNAPALIFRMGSNGNIEYKHPSKPSLLRLALDTPPDIIKAKVKEWLENTDMDTSKYPYDPRHTQSTPAPSLKFWMVWSGNASAPIVKHETIQQAQAEAKRLAAKYTHEFFVLECVGVAKRADPPVEYTNIF